MAEHRRFPRQSSPVHPRGAGRLLSLAIPPSVAIDPRTPRSLRTLYPSALPIRSLAPNQTSRGSNDGASSPWNLAITAASRYANTDRPC